MSQSLIAELRAIQIRMRSARREEADLFEEADEIEENYGRAYRKKWSEMNDAEREMRRAEWRTWSGVAWKKVYDPVGDCIRADIASSHCLG